MITKEIWQSGKYRELPEFSTQEGYYNEIRNFINKYGKPTTKDMVLVRSGHKEEETGNYGASWTTNLNICRRFAKWTNLSDTIYVTFVPAHTMAVHLPSKDMYEEEYVIDMEGKSNNVEIIAKHTGKWDYSSDFETEIDIDNWKLETPNLIKNVYKNNKKLLNNIF